MRNGKIRIVVLGTRGFPNVQGGIESHCEKLYPLLAKRGCEVIIFTRKPYMQCSKKTQYRGVTLVPLPCPKSKYLETFVHTLYGVFAAVKYRPDIIHIHAVGPALFAPLVRMLGFRVVMTNHGPDYERKKWGRYARSILKSGERLGSIWSNAVIAISKNIGDKIKQVYRREVSFIPNGVTIPVASENFQTLTRYGLIKKKYILAVGRLVPEKGFHDLIDAFNVLQKEQGQSILSGWKLVIAGCADHEDAYSSALKLKACKNPDILLVGFVKGEALQELYSHAGIFVCPSYYEGLSIALLEAMSYGLSCVVSDIEANKFVNLSAERYFTTGSVVSLADKLKEYLMRPISPDESGAEVNNVRNSYDWEKIADETLKVYDRVC